MKRFYIWMFAFGVLLVLATAVGAEEKKVPDVFSFQSVLYDDGGNLIADGAVGVTFRIKDLSDQILHEERQTLDVVHGQVSALIGNGLDSSGAPVGGITPNILNPTEVRYLEVQVDGENPVSSMEIASVPYAMYATKALSAEKNSITSDAILDGSIEYEDLSKNAMDKLAEALAAGQEPTSLITREELKTVYREPAAASTIGVKAQFINSGANNLQSVLGDLDKAIKLRDEKINTETSVRMSIDGQLQTNINNETDARNSAINGAIAAEVTARDLAINGAIATEVAARNLAINGAVASEATARDLAINGAVASEATARDLAISGAISGAINGGLKFDVVSGNGGIFIKDGVAGDNSNVVVSADFNGNTCAAISSVSYSNNVEGIDAFCSRTCWEEGSHSYRVRCWMDPDIGSGTGCPLDGSCNLTNPPDGSQGQACAASYLIICLRGN